jgi:hypothetical protein
LAKSSANLITSSAIAKQHAAAIVDSKMVVFGGDSGHTLLDDTRVVGFFSPVAVWIWNSALSSIVLFIS